LWAKFRDLGSGIHDFAFRVPGRAYYLIRTEHSVAELIGLRNIEMVELAEIRKTITSMSNEELDQMVGVDWKQYRTDVIEYAREEIRRRGSSFLPTYVPSENETDNRYFTQWQTYKRRRRLTWIIFFAAPLCVTLIGEPLAKFMDSALPINLILILWFVVFGAASAYVQYWKCPRCGKPFFFKSWYSNAHAKQCIHCGLPKWSGAGTASRHWLKRR
jgi:DNA-directed RNA polymerase subunit RPC12/RpoP